MGPAAAKTATRWERIGHLLKWTNTRSSRKTTDPWARSLSETEKLIMSKARAHAPKNPPLDLARVLLLAEKTPYLEDCLLAVDLLTNPVHWAPAVFPPTLAIPPSRVRKDFLVDMAASDIIAEFTGTPLAWGLLSSKAEPTKEVPRWRMISDMLWSNATLADSRKVHLSTLEQLLAMGARNRFAVTFDFSGWYYSLAVGELVQPFLCFRVGDKVYTHKRGPMGHKWFVFIAHTITKVLAWDPTVDIDVIIDNVFYASNDADTLEKARTGFIERSTFVHATLGEATLVATSATYRGMIITMGHHVAVKPSWLAKLECRITLCCAPEATAAMIFSVGGMLSWLRGVLAAPVLDDYWLWRTVAKAASLEQWKTIALPPHTVTALKAITQWASTSPTREITTVHRPPALIITDAMLAKPVGRWGAMTVTSTLRCFGGLFPLPLCKVASIADLETAAIYLTLRASPGLRHMAIHALTDNQVTDQVLRKRRCSAWRLHAFCRAIHASVSALGSTLTTSWIPSAENPTDGISRGRNVSDKDLELLRTLGRNIGMEWEGIAFHKNVNIMSVDECDEFLRQTLSR